MTGEIGLNFPADARLNPQFGGLLRAQWLRVVLKPEYDLTPWIEDAHRQGLKVLGVIARESLINDSYKDTAATFAARYGTTIDAIQGGNESDHESQSSWTLEPSELNWLLAEINIYFPSTTIVGPGLVSGDPHYLDSVDLDLVDAIAVHPYGRTPDTDPKWSQTPGNFGTVAQLLDSYRYHGKPMWVSEVGLSTTEVSEEYQAEYCEAMLKHLKLRTDVPVAMWFAADDLMVEQFGLYRSDHTPKPSAPAFMRAAGYTEEPVPDPNVHAIDVASYQPRDLGPLIHAYQAKHVVVHLYMPNEGPGPQYSRDQINSTRDNGATAGGYVFPYRPSDSVDYYFQNTLELCASVGLELPVCWVDCEPSPFGPGPDESWMDRWFALCDSAGMLSGLYCNPDWFNTHPGFHKYGPTRPLWLANWDGVADVTQPGWLPSGWTQLAGKQWEVSSGSLGEIDRDVFRPEYTVYKPTDPGEPDPCANLHRQIQAWIDAKPFVAPSKKKLKAVLAGG